MNKFEVVSACYPRIDMHYLSSRPSMVWLFWYPFYYERLKNPHVVIHGDLT